MNDLIDAWHTLNWMEKTAFSFLLIGVLGFLVFIIPGALKQYLR